MQQVTISRKLFAGCGAMLAITLIVGGIAIRNVGKLGESLDLLGGHYTRLLYLSGEIHSLTTDMVSTSRGILLRGHLKDTARASKLKEHYDEDVAALKRDSTELLEATTHSDVRDLVQDGVLDKINPLDKAASDVYEAVMRGDLATADTLNNEQVVPMGTTLGSAGANLATLETKYARAYADEATALVPSARYISIAMILLSAVVGGGVVYIVRDISRKLNEGISELRDGAEQVRNAASQVSASSQSLAQGASEQAASLEETSASSEEINSMARKNTDNSRSTAQLLAQSQTKVTLANQHLEEMVTSMNEITESSGKISKIIKVIDEIAFQTNILALNAAVEAARAGEAGMGFAVVADEVRSLAQRSAQAAKDTAILIEDSIARSGEGKGKVDQVALAIRAVTEDTARIKVMVDEVSLGSEEQSRGIEQIGRSIIQMEQVTQSAAANAEQSAAAAEQLNAQSQTMKDIVSRLHGMVDGEANYVATSMRTRTYQPAQSAHGSAAPTLRPLQSSGRGKLTPPGGLASTPAFRSKKSSVENEDFPMEDSFQSF